jgi:hypothetical protein
MSEKIEVTQQGAIFAFCKECIGVEGTPGCGTWKKQVQDCKGYDCPLYPFRPTPRGEPNGEPNEGAKYIRKVTSCSGESD